MTGSGVLWPQHREDVLKSPGPGEQAGCGAHSVVAEGEEGTNGREAPPDNHFSPG